MAARTITFSVQLGSGGYAVAHAVAEKLGFAYLDSEITSQAAVEAGVTPEAVAADEQSRSTLNRLMERLFTAGAMTPDLALAASAEADVMSSAIANLGSGTYRLFVENVVRRMALHGRAVVVGHASQVVLQGEKDVFKVLICGGPRARAERLAAEDGMKPAAAEESVRKSDRERRNFFRQAYGVDLLDPRLYDATFNTDNLYVATITTSLLSILTAGRPEPAAQPVAAPAVAPPPPLAARRRVPKTQHQDALHRAMLSLSEQAAAEDGDDAEWRRGLAQSLAALRRVFNRHARDAEGDAGTLKEVVQLKPQLSRRTSQIVGEHADIRRSIDDFAREIELSVEGGNGRESLRAHVTRLETALRLHEAKGIDLLFEAFHRDEGGPG